LPNSIGIGIGLNLAKPSKLSREGCRVWKKIEDLKGALVKENALLQLNSYS
jgi:hypothetical protein